MPANCLRQAAVTTEAVKAPGLVCSDPQSGMCLRQLCCSSFCLQYAASTWPAVRCRHCLQYAASTLPAGCHCPITCLTLPAALPHADCCVQVGGCACAHAGCSCPAGPAGNLLCQGHWIRAWLVVLLVRMPLSAVLHYVLQPAPPLLPHLRLANNLQYASQTHPLADRRLPPPPPPSPDMLLQPAQALRQAAVRLQPAVRHARAGAAALPARLQQPAEGAHAARAVGGQVSSGCALHYLYAHSQPPPHPAYAH